MGGLLTEWLKILQIEEEQEQLDRPNKRYQNSHLRVPIRRPLSDCFPHQPPLPHIVMFISLMIFQTG